MVVEPNSRAPTGPEPEDDRIEVDTTLIDEMLRMTPEERLRQNDAVVALVDELRRGFGIAAED